MRRRDFIRVLSTVAAWPVVARAQQSAIPIVGALFIRSLDRSEVAALQHGLAEGGYVEGSSVFIELRSAGGKLDQLPSLVADLVGRQVAVIIAGGLTSALAVKAATTTPIIFLAADDPVKFGLIASLSRPGGNATGLNLLTSELTTKRLELVQELLPNLTRVAVLVNPRTPEAEPQLTALQSKARAIGQQLLILNARNESELDAAFGTLAKYQNTSLLVTNDPFFRQHRDQLIALSIRHAVPTAYDRRAYVAAGGLMSYGTDYLDGYRKLGVYAAKILNGAKPADLPVEQSANLN